MEPHQPTMLRDSSAVSQSLKPKSNSVIQNPGDLSKESGVHRKETEAAGKQRGSIGILQVHIHQARDIHNICIYHKQDVYAKIYLTSDPEKTVSTQIVNGGGKNPIFNESLQLSVRAIDSSLKCEIWMLSRVRNYLEDQLLGFAMVPLSDVVTANGKLSQEFSLSSSDLFHSPAGFVDLTLTYTGASPEVLEISSPRLPTAVNLARQDPEVPISVPSELDKIEFPDPKIVKENEMMVSEYFGIPSPNLDSTSSQSDNLGKAENGKCLGLQDTTVQTKEGFSKGLGIVEVSKVETSPSGVSTSASPSISIPVSSQTAPQSLNQEVVSSLKEKTKNADESGTGSSALPLFNVKIEPEQKVVQQDIVDMYMKSMQQFTESLAKMKLPLDIDSEPAVSGNTNSEEMVQASKSSGKSPRVFYGSRAFF